MAEPLARIIEGDCIEAMAAMEPGSVDAVVCDPPYGLEFMGKDWDKLARPKAGNLGGFADGNKPSFERVRSHLPAMQGWHHAWATEALRVLKPGGHLLAFGGTRTYHRLACAIEDAGFEVRDCIAWLYGTGLPKSLDVSKAIDKAAGITEWEETRPNPAWRAGNGEGKTTSTGWDKPQRPPKPVVETESAKAWQGWGTALKPAFEPIVLARKPLALRRRDAARTSRGVGTGAGSDRRNHRSRHRRSRGAGIDSSGAGGGPRR